MLVGAPSIFGILIVVAIVVLGAIGADYDKVKEEVEKEKEKLSK